MLEKKWFITELSQNKCFVKQEVYGELPESQAAVQIGNLPIPYTNNISPIVKNVDKINNICSL